MMRATIRQIDKATARVVGEDGLETRLQLAHTPFESLLRDARVGDTVAIHGGHTARGTVTPDIVVLDPDLLVDVTTLCSCLRSYGFHALNALLSRFEARETSWQIQLGNMAGEFFDTCVYTDAPDFKRAAAKAFHASPLTYTTVEGIDAGFFHDARKQFDNIRQTVQETLPTQGINPRDIVLEPQFLSPELGLQGRLDALAIASPATPTVSPSSVGSPSSVSPKSPTTIIELKSGKADEFRGGRAKEEHELQMTLYDEILHRHARCLLFYSRYPRLLPVTHTLRQFQESIAVRNSLVALDRATREGGLMRLIDGLRLEDFNTRGEDGKLWNNYQRPVVERFLHRMQGLPAIERAYFNTFATFIAREQEAAKRKFAQTWLAAPETLESEGEAVTGLAIEPIEDTDGSIVELRARIKNELRDLSAVNFRLGDSVMLFAPGTQVTRCTIVGLGSDTLHLSLAYRQRSAKVFSGDLRYTIVHSYMEATFTQAYRGLTALITAPDERRRLLLGMTKPDNDYRLVVGPPGTGKTNVLLRGMVREALAEGQTILLAAYTNQAVDEICGVLEDECPTIYARIGNENVCAAPYRRRTIQSLTADASNRQEVIAAVEPLRVIAGTIASLTSRSEIFALKRFDITIIDEASQVLEPQLLPLLCRVGRFVLIGDHKQLPAVVAQDTDQCGVSDPALRDTLLLTSTSSSYFERLHALQRHWGIEDSTVITLTKQGRMHEELMAFANSHFYGGTLCLAGLPHQTARLPYNARRLLFVDSEPGGQKVSQPEASIVAGLIEEARRQYEAAGLTFTARAVGVIVPFRAQIAAIRAAVAANDHILADALTIDTVERYQGSQRDIIIFSTVVSDPSMLDILSAPVRLADGTEVDRKLNVALTRARERFILVGHRRTLMRSTLYAELIKHLEQ